MYKVLIIDDEPWSREVVKSLGDWAGLGLAVVGEAEDGNAGLRAIGELRPDIAVTDMRMPGKEGAELLQDMHERYPELKIIVMSGYDDFVYLKQAIRSKAVEYLLKPVHPEELNAALAQCRDELDRENARQETVSALSPLFGSGAAMQRYAGMRERIYASLLELNRDGIADSFRALRQFLAEAAEGGAAEQGAAQDAEAQETAAGRTPGNGAEGGVPAVRIAQDLLLMLEQFLAEQDAGLERLLRQEPPPLARDGAAGTEAAIAGVQALFEEAAEALLALRQGRNRLDMDEVRRYIDARYQDAISLETAAQQFLISKEHLSRMFKAHTGENVTDYIIRRRMEKARALILEDGLSIKHAALLAGYEDIAYFYRVFKKHYGITPGELRGKR